MNNNNKSIYQNGIISGRELSFSPKNNAGGKEKKQ